MIDDDDVGDFIEDLIDLIWFLDKKEDRLFLFTLLCLLGGAGLFALAIK